MSAAPIGLVLAGGLSRRMGRDKGALEYAGEPQVLRASRLLGRFCPRVLVSIRPEQARSRCYRGLARVEDEGRLAGPAAGLLAAWRREPAAALLALAVDLPLVDAALVAALVAARDPARLATAFRHPDGTIEPLCAIWEPAARAELCRRAEHASPSLRRLLEDTGVGLLQAAEPERLRSVNTPEDYARAAALLERAPGR